MAHRAVCMSVLSIVLMSCAGVLDLEHVPYRDGDAGADAASNDASNDSSDAISDAISDASADVSADARRSTNDPSCDVKDDGLLHCTNRADAPLRAQPTSSAPVVNVLHTTSSYFSCWGIGEPHAGGNSTWYYALGDETASYGWLPAVMLNTPDDFDADPSAFGLPKCS